nr:RNA-binding protein [Cytophagales bacterium]
MSLSSNAIFPVLLLNVFIFYGCGQKETAQHTLPKTPVLFSLLSGKDTGVTFENTLTEGLNTNILMYEYFYNGGGVAVGDVNGDGLDDIYFTGNMVPNALYLNKGNMQFEDITQQAGVAGRQGPWTTGVTMADVNGDGLLDIYVCNSGSLPPDKRKNQLFINQGANADGLPQFSEQAEAYGIASDATSTHAVFFDFDNDGDLDLFLLNHNPKSLPVLDESITAELLKTPDSAGPQLYRNEGGQFVEITQKAGIQQSALSYGLGAGVADINGDGYSDIYISNDYTVPDFLYINNGNGTFTDIIRDAMGHISNFSMGNDIADINNDGLMEVFTLDMLPEGNERQKLLMAPDNYEKFDFNLRVGFHHQYMRNMLHLNHGNGTFSEIGQLAGISNTDWSWAALFADFDNDGWKDLYITNGYHRDYTNMDFLKYMSDYLKNNQGLRRENVLDLVYKMPSSNVINCAFRNTGGITFEDQTETWGLNHPANSNGAAYADLDNDGDLDLIVNNVSHPVFIYRNDADALMENNYLKIKLAGGRSNSHGIGAKVTLHYGDNKQYLQQMPSRGYQSSVSPTLHFGLGKVPTVDSLYVEWPGGQTQVLYKIPANQSLLLTESNADLKRKVKPTTNPLYTSIPSPIKNSQPPYTINDFKRQPLMVNPQSFTGPAMAKADVNGDGLEDVFVGGDPGVPGKLYIQQATGTFKEMIPEAFISDQTSADSKAVFADLDGDGHVDLYVGSGGYGEFIPMDENLQDRIYRNDGKGNFKRVMEALPSMRTSTGAVAVADFTGDGAPDIFVGSRVIPGRYPEVPPSYLLVNDGKGNFSDETKKYGPTFDALGLVTDAHWEDLDNDGLPELIIVGEWMPISIWDFSSKMSENVTKKYFEQTYEGWWNSLTVADVNGDGKPDLLVGNHGLNSQVRASNTEPAELYYKDFDNNGAIDPILCFYIDGKSYPYVTRDELLDQISAMRTRFRNYADYANLTIAELFSPEEIEDAGYLKATILETAYFESRPNGGFLLKPLPIQAQFAPVFSILAHDADGDGNKDLILGGNIEAARLRFGKYDANFGIFLRGDGKGGFTYVPQVKSGLNIQGDIRSIVPFGNMVLFGINQKGVVAFKMVD